MSEKILVSENLQELARAVDTSLQAITGKRIGFSLVVFTEDRAQYVGNVAREDAEKALRAVLEAWASGMPNIPEHQRN